MKIIYRVLFSIVVLTSFYSNGFSQATLTIGTVSGTSGNSVLVPIQATGISDMVGFQFTITYDKTKLTFVNCTNWVTGLNAAQVQINPLDGMLTFVYTDAAINIANGKFFDLNFTVVNGASASAAISWSDSPTQRELSNSVPNEISCVYSNGAVVISVAALLAPVATTATGIAQTSFSANWNASASATGYRLDVALDNAFTNYLTGYQNKDVGNVTTLQVIGCVANTIYYYRVRAYNSGETSVGSNTINLTTLQSSILVPPVAIAASNITQTGFSANWNSSATATGYRLDVALDNAFTNYLAGYQNKDVGNVTTLTVTGLLSGTTYFYRVKAYNTGETSGVSNTINVTTLSIQNGATLTIGNGTGSSGNTVSIPVSATNFSDVVGFQFTIVYDQTKLTFVNCTNWVTGLNAVNVQINQLEGKLTFVYTDAAINISSGKFFDLNFTIINGSSGNAAISWSDNPTQRELSNSIPNEISCIYTNGAVVISGTSLLAPVANAAYSITQTSFFANWNTSATATGYFLDVAFDNAFTSYLIDYQNKDVGNNTARLVSGLVANTIYYYRIKAYNSGGTSGFSNTINATTVGPPVANFSATPNSDCTPLTVTFTDESTGTPTSWAWDIDNNGVIDYTVKNPTHMYSNSGTYSVKLTVTNASGTNSKTLSNYITANSTLTPNVSINVSPSRIINSGQLVTFTTSPTNGGTIPKYQWKVNGINVGSNSPTYFSSTLTNGQIVSCEMTSNSPCASPTVATSNSITMSVSATTTASVEISIKTGSNPTCLGELVTFTASPTNGGTAPSYIWKIGSTVVGNGASYTTNNLSDGQVVTCEITSNDAWVIQKTATSNAITMKVNSSLVPSVSIALTSGSNPSNDGQSLTFTATSTNGGASPSYQWKVNGSDVGDSRPTFSSIYIRDGQVISCEMYSSSTCANPTKATSNTITMKVNFPVSSETISVTDFIKVYPNPTTGIITIEGLPENHKTKIAVYTANGKLIMKKTTFANQDKIDISKQVPGTYLLVVNKQTVKIIKE